MAEELRFDFASTGAGGLQRDLKGNADASVLAAKGARLLADALESQRKSALTSAGASISLAKADKILADAEHALSDEALKADLALRREADAAQKSGRAAADAAAQNSRLADSLRKVGDSAIFKPSFKGALLGLSPALIPLAGGIAAGVGAIGVSFGAATIGAGAFGIAVKSVLSSASSDLAKLQAAQLRLNTATTAATRKSAQAALDQLKSTFAPGYLALLGQLETFKTRWKAVSQAIAVPALSAFLPALTKGLQFLVPALTPVANVFAAWGQTLNKYFSSPAAANNIKSAAAAFGQFSAIQLGNIGQFIGDIAKGIFNLGKDLFSSGFNFSAVGGWLQNIGAGFATWSKSANARADVQGFLHYLHNEGPLVTGILSNLGKILPGIFQGASAVGQLELQAISGFLGLIAKLPKGWQVPLTEAAGALLLLSKTGVIKIGFTIAGAAVSFVKKLLGGGSVELGGAAAAGEIEAAFRAGGAAAAAEIRAAMTAGGAAGGAAAAGEGAGGEFAAGGAAGAVAKSGLWRLAGGILAGAFIAGVNVKLPGGHKTIWQLGDPPPPGQQQTWYNSWSGFGHGILNAFSGAVHAGASAVLPGGVAQYLLQPGKMHAAATQVAGDLIHTAGPAINDFRGALERAANAVQNDFRPQLARLHADSPAVKQDMDKLASSIQSTGTKSAQSKSDRQEMIHDLEQSGVKASTARGLVDNYIKRLQAIPAHVSTQIQATGSGQGKITFKDQIAGQNAQGFLEFHAQGGMISGGTPGRDSVLSALTPGEVVVPAPMVGAGAVDHLRGRLPGFASGGLVGGSHSPVSALVPFEARREAAFYEQAIGQGFKDARDAAKHLAHQFAGLPPGGTATPGLVTVAKYLLANGASKVAAAAIAGTIAGESTGDPESVGSGGAGLLGWTPPSSAYPILPLVTGNPGRDMAVQLVDMMAYISRNGSIADLNRVAASGGALAAAWHFSQAYERPRVTGSDIRPDVIASLLARGYDSGGYLPPGLSLAYNGTGRPEPVIPAGRAGGSKPTVVIRLASGGSALDQALKNWIKQAVRVDGGGDVQVAFG